MSHTHSILIVDDDADFVEATAAYLADQGFAVFKAYDGSEGLRIARLERPDLIVMDIMMTERTEGIYAVQAIRRVPELRTVPILVASSLYDHVPDFCIPPDERWLPFDRFLRKPIDPPRLLSIIREYLADSGSTTMADANTSEGT